METYLRFLAVDWDKLLFLRFRELANLTGRRPQNNVRMHNPTITIPFTTSAFIVLLKVKTNRQAI